MAKFIDKITSTGTSDVPAYSEQLFLKAKADAESIFDANLETEVRKQLKYHNIIVPDSGTPEWDQFIAYNLTHFTVDNTDTHVISYGATDDGAGVITDIGTKLVEWQDDGYTLKIESPVQNITTFE